MNRPRQQISVVFRIEIWYKDKLLRFYDHPETFAVSDYLRQYATQLGIPLETAAYLIMKPEIEKQIGAVAPLQVKVLPGQPLQWQRADAKKA